MIATRWEDLHCHFDTRTKTRQGRAYKGTPTFLFAFFLVNATTTRGCPPRLSFQRDDEEGTAPPRLFPFQRDGEEGCPLFVCFLFNATARRGCPPPRLFPFQHDDEEGCPPPLPFQHNGEEGLSPSSSVPFSTR